LDARLLLPVSPCLPDFPLPEYDHNKQYADYCNLDPGVFPVAFHYCHPSIEVERVAVRIAKCMANRTVILYRGNDKVTERPRVSYQSMFDAARKLGGPYWVQTDEEEFRVAFLEEFSTRENKTSYPSWRVLREFTASWPPLFAVRRSRSICDSLEFLPTFPRNESIMSRPAHPQDRPIFAVRFLAALFAMRHAEKLVVTSDNSALWAVLWRGHSRGVLQIRR
jgi:hypothetical protein